VIQAHQKLSSKEAHERSVDMLNRVGIPNPQERVNNYPHQLSGGQRQRLTVARALLVRPRLIVADEPVSMVDASLRATILESLQTLYADFGISFVFITHDLTTAYQVSDRIVVLYRGTVAEVGDVDLVIQDPRHPYSQLLVASIPEPDVEHRWVDEDAPPLPEINSPIMRGCPFADRCPHVMSMCRESVPPLFRIEQARAAACFLYRDFPALPSDAVDAVLRPARGGLT